MVEQLRRVLLQLMIVHLDNTNSETISRGAFFFSFFIVPIWLVMNRMVQWILQMGVKTLKIYDDNLPENSTEEEREQNEKGKIFYMRGKTMNGVPGQTGGDRTPFCR